MRSADRISGRAICDESRFCEGERPVAPARNTIVRLDDEPDRIAVMAPLLAREYPGLSVAVFGNAPDLLAWLERFHAQMCFVCLDHDLGPNQQRGGEVFDPGTGRDVADRLACLRPCCPILIHTTNYQAAPGMVAVLEGAGWSVARVSPYGDTEWIGQDWIEAIRAALPQ